MPEINPKPWWSSAVMLFFRVSTWIAIPVIFALFIGKFLDKKLGTSPWLFLVCTFVAFIISIVGITKTTLKEMKKIQEEAEEKDTK
jgi:F0F1-type ATP synthase assembly protein I